MWLDLLYNVRVYAPRLVSLLVVSCYYRGLLCDARLHQRRHPGHQEVASNSVSHARRGLRISQIVHGRPVNQEQRADSVPSANTNLRVVMIVLRLDFDNPLTNWFSTMFADDADVLTLSQSACFPAKISRALSASWPAWYRYPSIKPHQRSQREISLAPLILAVALSAPQSDEKVLKLARRRKPTPHLRQSTSRTLQLAGICIRCLKAVSSQGYENSRFWSARLMGQASFAS